MVDIIVLVKQMHDLEQIKPDPSTGEPMLEKSPFKMETISENAVEAAVQLKEKYGGKVTALLFGNSEAGQIMKKAYAMGCDDGYVITEYTGNNHLYTSQVLAEKIKTIKHDLILLGNQSADSVTGMLAGRLSAILGEPVLGNAVSIEIEGEDAKIKRVLEKNNYYVKTHLPAIISVTQEINEPRLPPVMRIMQAGRKPINSEKTTVQEIKNFTVVSNKAPISERKKLIFEDVDKGIEEVVKVIKEEMR